MQEEIYHEAVAVVPLDKAEDVVTFSVLGSAVVADMFVSLCSIASRAKRCIDEIITSAYHWPIIDNSEYSESGWYLEAAGYDVKRGSIWAKE